MFHWFYVIYMHILLFLNFAIIFYSVPSFTLYVFIPNLCFFSVVFASCYGSTVYPLKQDSPSRFKVAKRIPYEEWDCEIRFVALCCSISCWTFEPEL